MNRFFCWFVKLTGWLPFNLLCRPKYYFEDASVQSRHIQGGAIVVCNHHSVWDFAGVLCTFFWRNLRCIVAELIFEKGVLMNKFMRWMGSIRVDRGSNDFAFVSTALDVLDNGGVVEIFPEARIPRPGEPLPLPFVNSVGIIAIKSGAKIVPVVTNGRYFSKQRLRVLVGRSIDVNDFMDTALDERQNIELVTQRLRERISSLSALLNEQSSKGVANEQAVL